MSTINLKSSDFDGHLVVNIVGEATVNVTDTTEAHVNVASARGSSSYLCYEESVGFVSDRSEEIERRVNELGKTIVRDFKDLPSPANGDIILGTYVLLRRYREMLDLNETKAGVPHITVDDVSRPLSAQESSEYRIHGTIGARSVRAVNRKYANQISDLAQFIVDHFDGEPSKSEGAVDTAKRLLGDFAEAKTEARRIIDLIESVEVWDAEADKGDCILRGRHDECAYEAKPVPAERIVNTCSSFVVPPNAPESSCFPAYPGAPLLGELRVRLSNGNSLVSKVYNALILSQRVRSMELIAEGQDAQITELRFIPTGSLIGESAEDVGTPTFNEVDVNGSTEFEVVPPKEPRTAPTSVQFGVVYEVRDDSVPVSGVSVTCPQDLYDFVVRNGGVCKYTTPYGYTEIIADRMSREEAVRIFNWYAGLNAYIGAQDSDSDT